MTRRMSVGILVLALCATLIGGLGSLSVEARASAAHTSASASPIKHVVIIFQENHSFDNLLGPLCVNVLQNRCHGVTAGKKHDGSTQILRPATDLVPKVAHEAQSQRTAINGGAMNGFDQIHGCKATDHYACYAAFDPPQPGHPGFIPNVAALAQQYVIADHTFESNPDPSWGSHLSLVASQLDGFVGNIPFTGTRGLGEGWGCDSKKDALWQSTPTSPIINVPSCVPNAQGAGPYKSSPVKSVPTILDRLQGAGLNFKLYADDKSKSGYIWSICPTFAGCLLSNESKNMVGTQQILQDTAPGGPGLPAYSVVLPNGLGPTGHSDATSQHNDTLMSVGDNWIGKVVQSIQSSADWSSTAIFLAWDDCGCFYDDVSPPPGTAFGVRVPMVIISPFAKQATTDSTPASFASTLAFTEHVFSLQPLSANDASAYDYFGSFNFVAKPNLTKTTLVQQPISPAAEQQVAGIPIDSNDST